MDCRKDRYLKHDVKNHRSQHRGESGGREGKEKGRGRGKGKRGRGTNLWWTEMLKEEGGRRDA
jgi:hypothetical protein